MKIRLQKKILSFESLEIPHGDRDIGRHEIQITFLKERSNELKSTL